MGAPVLCVDLDGTLIRSDSLHESMISVIARSPWMIFSLLRHLLRGRSAFKAWAARNASLGVQRLPYRESLVTHLREARATGRRITLVTAANERIAIAVAEHLKLFDDVMASSDTVNLKGEAKADALVRRYGAHGFEYFGDSMADIPVWQRAQAVHVAGSSSQVRRAIASAGLMIVHQFDPEPPSLIRLLLKSLRVHQWLKNLLVFAPLIASLSVNDPVRLTVASVAFLLFGMVASSIYIVNDLVDLPSDREHPRKRNRPFASGALPLEIGPAMAIGLCATAFAVSIRFMPGYFTAVLLIYLGATTAYSFFLKRVVIADVLMLAGLYTIRIVAGAFAIRVVPTFWLLAFAMFIFFGLALMKRFTEVHERFKTGGEYLPGRGYRASDLRLLGSLGASSSMASVLVLALYINSQDVTRQYPSPFLLWMLCPLLLYWLGRLWLHAERGQMHDDPVVFAVKDPYSRLVAAIGALVLSSAALLRADIWPSL